MNRKISCVLPAGAKLEPQTSGSGGVDLACLEAVELHPHRPTLVNTGVRLHIDDPALAGLLMVRSSLSMMGVGLANGVGLIDSDYQGEIQACLINHGNYGVSLLPHTRIAQILFIQIVDPTTIEFEPTGGFASRTIRGEGGWGSTGRGS